jgi:hypothetical protein
MNGAERSPGESCSRSGEQATTAVKMARLRYVARQPILDAKGRVHGV